MKNVEYKRCCFCQSEIPENAVKCRYCLEWQEDSDYLKRNNRDRKIPLKFEFYGKKPFQLKIVEKIPLHYAVSIVILGVISFMSLQFMWYNLNENEIYLFSFLIFHIQFVVSWAGLIWFYKIVNENSFLFGNFYRSTNDDQFIGISKLYNKIFYNRFCIFVGIILGLTASIGDFVLNPPFFSFEAKLGFLFFEFVNMFFAGCALYSLLIFAVFIYRVTLNADIACMQNVGFSKGIKDIGEMHLKISGLAIIPLILGIMAKLFGDWEWSTAVIVWYVLFALVIIVYIYWPMLNIHKLMKKEVEQQALSVEMKIQNILLLIDRNPSSKNFRVLNELRQLEKLNSSQRTWPFDTKSISAAFIAIIFPILLMIVDKIWLK